jgi:opacity protein-like surface antigen
MKLRSLLAVALLAPAVALAAPAKSGSAAKSAAAPTSAASPLDGLEVGGFVGYETDDVSGLSLRLDGEIPFRELSPQVKLSWVGSVGYSRLTWDYGFGASINTNVFKLVPAARFSMPLTPQFSVFGDVGLGLAYVSATIDLPAPFSDITDSTINLMMRLGVGAFYQVNERMKIGAMLELDPIFGDYGFSSTNGVSGSSQTTFLIQAGMMYRL